jgi:hypothetical protein
MGWPLRDARGHVSQYDLYREDYRCEEELARMFQALVKKTS